MELFNIENFEKLSQIEDKICISIYIPTHESGIQVNEGVDRIQLKNKLQDIKLQLEGINYPERNIDQLLKPAFQLWEDINFWRYQSNGLALFLKENECWAYRLPLSFNSYSAISKKFILNPLLPLISEDILFFTLALSQSKVRLFKNTSFAYEELDITNLIPKNIKEIFSQYDFDIEEKDKNIVREALIRTQGKGPLPSHGEFPEDAEYKYITDYLRSINNGITKVLKGQKAPMVICTVDFLFGLFKEVNTYDHLINKAAIGNPDYLSERDLHKKALDIAKDSLSKPRKKALEKYHAWAGTGKTSYDLANILNAAYEGRVESLFIKETNVWANYDEDQRKIDLTDRNLTNRVCLLNLSAAKTIENNGAAFLVSNNEMPANVNTNIAAIFRY